MTGIGSSQQPFTATTTATVLRKACRVAGLETQGARLMRLGSNAVYRLASPIVVRIARAGTNIDDACRMVAIARWLKSIGFPAVRALDVEQPAVIDGCIVTFWEALSNDGDEYGSAGELASILIRLHSLEPPADLHIPPLSPFGKAAQRIDTNRSLSSYDVSFLRAQLADLQDKYAALEFTLPQGVIHGDASVGNVIRDKDSTPVLIDLDGFAIGPREWDLILTAIYYDSFGWHTREEYETFVDVYGFDVMQWPGYPVLREVREFLMVVWLSQKADESETLAEEVANRIFSLRTGGSRRGWQPY
jgi:aminoglycoside phosphotransferase (APT) family kinase protein